MTQRRGEGSWVFLVHSLERIGPPVYLLHFLRWLRANTDVEVEVVAVSGGPLEGGFGEVGALTVLGDPEPAWASGPGGQAATAVRDRWFRFRLRHLTDPALVHVNTAWSMRALPFLPPTDAPVVAHVHELEVGLDYYLGPARFRLLQQATSRWVAASQAAADNLVERHDVAAELITVHHEMVDVDAASRHPIVDVRAELGLAGHAPVVGTAAVLDWRKGTDLFLRLAATVARSRPDLGAHFVWLGAEPGSPGWQRVHRDIAAAGLGDCVHIVPAVAEPLAWLRAFDLFALTSREDAFPLACLEAASVRVPTVCFDSGGMSEFVEDDAGAVVAFPDVANLAATVADLLDDRDRLRALGDRAAAKVRERHDVSVAAPLLYRDLSAWTDS